MTENASLIQAITEAQRYLTELPNPQNEANTCDWVIRPLLVALGYANHEIFAQSADNSNKFPDYTILPNTQSMWYLEAKAWNVALDSTHVTQAINYAHQNGRRWVVLSNGREWRLYDDTIQGVSADREVASAQLDDEVGLRKFLDALSKESIMANKVVDFAAERRVRDYLLNAIQNPSSPIIKAIADKVKEALTPVKVSPETIVSILNSANPAPAPVPVMPAYVIGKIGSPYAGSLPNADEGEIFLCSGPHAEARGRFDNGGLWVLAGSKARREGTPSDRDAVAKKVLKLQQEGKLVEEGPHYVLLEDSYFNTPSGAAVFVLARAANGWTEWHLRDGTVLDQVHPRTKGR